MASDCENFVARRFDRLHVRAILTLQAQLEQKEAQLNSMDTEYSLDHVKAVGADPPQIITEPITPELLNSLAATHGELGLPRDINNGTIRDDMPQRAALVADITQKLEQYGEPPPSC